jgi:hypothetical protein
VALLAVPELGSRQWLGPVSAEPGTQVAVRALGARDMLLGFLALHTLDTPAGPRMLRACAAADIVDGTATFIARRKLPAAGAWGTIVLAGGAAVRGFLVAGALTHESA